MDFVLPVTGTTPKIATKQGLEDAINAALVGLGAIKVYDLNLAINNLDTTLRAYTDSEILAAELALGVSVSDIFAAAASANEDADNAAASATAAQGSASSATVSASQATLAAFAAGAPLYTASTLPASVAARANPYMLQTAVGVQVFSHNGTVATFVGWLGTVNFTTRAMITTTATGTTLDRIVTQGYSAANDGGGATYRRAASEPAHPGKVQSSDGVWWEMVEFEPSIEMFGGKADAVYTDTAITSGTDNLQPFYDTVAYLRATYLAVRPICPLMFGARTGAYRFSSHVNVKLALHIKCRANSGQTGPVSTVCVFPPNSSGFIIHRGNTIDYAKETVSTGDGGSTIWEGPRVVGTGGTSDTGYGIWARARMEFRNPHVHNFSYASIRIVATSGSSTPAREGNANACLGYGGVVSGSRYGIEVEGADVNAGVWYGLNARGNKIAGIRDNAFLNFEWVAPSTDGNVSVEYPTLAYNNGYSYTVINPVLASTTEPTFADAYPNRPFGVGPTMVWAIRSESAGPGENIPQWASGTTYYQGGGVMMLGDSSRSARRGGYDEPNQADGYVAAGCASTGGSARAIGPGAANSNASSVGLALAESKLFRSVLTSETTVFEAFNYSTGTNRYAKFDFLQSYLSDGITKKKVLSLLMGGSQTLPTFRIDGNTGADSNTMETLLEILGAGSKRIMPGGDNLWTFGFGNRRLKEIFAASAIISTSDEREKEQIETIPDEWLDAWGDVEWVRYKWKASVAAKGDAARWHTGLIAQRVRDVFADHGINGFGIGLLCFDEWDEEREDILATDPETGEETKTGERVVVDAGDRYSLRPDLAFALEAAWTRRALTALSVKP